MKDLKQKPYQEDQEDETKEHQGSGGDITQLSGSPDPTAVSRVAMGGDAKTDFEHSDEYNGEWIKRLKGEEKNPDLCSIEEAFAKMFEGLAGIMHHKS